MMDLRLRSKISDQELQQKVGKILTDDDFNLLVTRDVLVRKPNGKPLLVYRRGALSPEVMEASYPTLHELRKLQSDNRGHASGYVTRTYNNKRNRTTTQDGRIARVPSATIGSFDPTAPVRPYCRLTAFSRKEGEKYEGLFPLFQEIGALFQKEVPDRWARQMEFAQSTRPEWVVPGTPFTTITVNNTYPTGVHKDKDDLDEGFSTLACLRFGDFTGGILVFPEYRVGVDMRHGDVLLMDAHEWHGNTALQLHTEDAERISVVCYYRTGMASCGTMDEESDKAVEFAERRAARREEAQV